MLGFPTYLLVLSLKQLQWQSLLPLAVMWPADFDRLAEFLQWSPPQLQSPPPWLRLRIDFRFGEDDLWRRDEEFKLLPCLVLWWWWWRPSCWSCPGSSEQLSLRYNDNKWSTIDVDTLSKKAPNINPSFNQFFSYQLLPWVDWWQLLHVRLKLSLLSSIPESLDKLWCGPSFLESPCRLQDDRISFPCFRLDELLGVLDRFSSPLRVAEDDLVLERLVECLRWWITSSYDAGSELETDKN